MKPPAPRTPKILYSDAAWVVVDKPTGWISRPGQGEHPVISQHLEAEFGRIWIVHRLDLETTGVLLFARTAEAHREASIWFEKHQVKKVYHFLAQGKLASPMMRIDLPIEGAASRTQVERLASVEGAFLGRAVPLTGRRHQIRIHLAKRGHPLWGDVKYGGLRETSLPNGEKLAIGRVALHAAKLTLPNGLVFDSPWPADFAKWAQSLGLPLERLAP